MQCKQKNGIDRSRRRWLIATSVAGGMGGGAAAMPFVGSLAPSERARAADAQVADPQSQHPFSIPLPEYCRNPYRARTEHPYLLVLIGICTHLGCSPVA